MLKNKVIVVAGGAGLLGKAFVRAILANHGTAIIADSNIDAALTFKQEVLPTDPATFVECHQLDITSAGSIQELIQFTHAKFGRIDGVLNTTYPRNKNYGRKLELVSYPDFCDNVGLHLGGYFQITREFCQFFSNQGWGTVLNLASVYGVIAPRFEIYHDTPMTMPVEYSVIKAGLIHLTKYFAKYYKGVNIRINSVSPGGILDNQPEKFIDSYKSFCIDKGMLDPADLSGTICFLLSDQSRYINGQNIIVDDGFTL